MKGSLARILRLRALLEEESRLGLEKLSSEANRIEGACEAERRMVSNSRGAAFSLLEGQGSQSRLDGVELTQEAWLVAVGEGSLAAFREERLEALRKVSAKRLETGRDEMLQLRKARQQAEILLRQEGERRRTELERNWQRGLDDWYAAAFFRRKMLKGKDRG
ncbi:MAG TPA: hypothetical protein VK670_10995 [Silvibacterium sp.]|nr:hypothetical protein [Silvibacterium sp.]